MLLQLEVVTYDVSNLDDRCIVLVHHKVPTPVHGPPLGNTEAQEGRPYLVLSCSFTKQNHGPKPKGRSAREPQAAGSQLRERQASPAQAEEYKQDLNMKNFL